MEQKHLEVLISKLIISSALRNVLNRSLPHKTCVKVASIVNESQNKCPYLVEEAVLEDDEKALLKKLVEQELSRSLPHIFSLHNSELGKPLSSNLSTGSESELMLDTLQSCKGVAKKLNSRKQQLLDLIVNEQYKAVDTVIQSRMELTMSIREQIRALETKMGKELCFEDTLAAMKKWDEILKHQLSKTLSKVENIEWKLASFHLEDREKVEKLVKQYNTLQNKIKCKRRAVEELKNSKF